MTVARILLTFIAMEQAILLEELKRLFATAIKFDEFEFVNVLIGYNGMGDQRALTHLYESRAYIADMKNQMSSTPNLHTKTRLALHIYCHLFEMDELYNILGNLLRIAIGQKLRYLPELYSGREELMTPTEKFVKLKDLAEQCRFEEFLRGLEDLYSNKIRNAFLHSAYSLIDDDFCIVKGDGIKIGGSSHQSVSIENYLMPLITSAINFIDTLFGLIDENKLSYRANKIVQARMPELQPVVILGDAEKGLIGFQTFVGSWIKIKSAYGTEHFVEAMNLRISNHNGPNHDLNERLEQYVEKLTPFGKDFDAVRDEVIATKDAALLNNLAMVYYNRANNIAMTAEGKPARQQDAIYKSAKQYYDLSIATNPAFARSYHNMGTALIKQAETNNSLDLKLRLDVLALFDKTISVDKNMFEAWLNSARMVFEIGLDEVDAEKQFSLFQDSIVRYQNAIELYPRDAEAHSSKARVHLKLARMGMVARTFLPSSKIVKKPLKHEYSYSPETLGEHIRKKRIEAGQSQRAVACIIGVTEDSITFWENGRSKPQVHHYPAIIAFLGYYPFSHETETVAGKLLRVRYHNGWSYKQIAIILGVDPATIRRWEFKKYPVDKRLHSKIINLWNKYKSTKTIPL